ncbi:MAG: CoA-binding protein [Myxococcales bacterium]|nr:CoA-binding protein [Myxococcales bacterium]
MRKPPQSNTEADDPLARSRRILESARTIAVLGAHPVAERPAHYVPAYLHDHGYRVLPVNATLAGTTLFDAPVLGSLDAIDEPVDVVDVFRRAEALPGHVDEILAMNPRPKVVWFQLGIRHDLVAARLRAEGIEVVQDRCMLADHRRLFGQPGA